MSVTPTPSDDGDDFDLYADLPEEACHTESAKQQSEEYEALKKTLQKLQCDLELTRSHNEKLRASNNSLACNISVLFKTASAEIKRKDDKIAELHRELDNLAFRRTSKKRNQPTAPEINMPSGSEGNVLKPERHHPTHQSLASTTNLSNAIEVDVLKQSLRATFATGNKCTSSSDDNILKGSMQHSAKTLSATGSVVSTQVGVGLPSLTNSCRDLAPNKVLAQESSFIREKQTQSLEETKTPSPIKTIPKKRKIPEYSTVSDERLPVNHETAPMLSRSNEKDKMREVKAPLKKSVFERLGTKHFYKKEDSKVVLEDKTSKPPLTSNAAMPFPDYKKKSEVPNIHCSSSAMLNSLSDAKLHGAAPQESSTTAHLSPSPNAIEPQENALIFRDTKQIPKSESCTVQNNVLMAETNQQKNFASRKSEFSSLKCIANNPIEEFKVPKHKIVNSDPNQCQGSDNVEGAYSLKVECNPAISIIQKGTSERVEPAAQLPKELEILSVPPKEKEVGEKVCSEVQISFQPPLPLEAPKPPPPLPLTSPPPTPIKDQKQCVIKGTGSVVLFNKVDSQPDLNHTGSSQGESPAAKSSENINKSCWSNENLLIQCPFKPRRRAKSVVLHPIETTAEDSPSLATAKQDVSSTLKTNSVSIKLPDYKYKKTPLKKTDSYENRLAPESRSYHSQRSVYSSRHLSSVKSFSHMPERRSPSELLSGRSGRIERLPHQDKIRVRLRDRRSRSLSPQRRRIKQDGYRTRNGQNSESNRRSSRRVQDMKNERCQEQKKAKSVTVNSKHPIGNEKGKQDSKDQLNAQRMADLFGESSPEPEEKTSRRSSKSSKTQNDNQTKSVLPPVYSQKDSTSISTKCHPESSPSEKDNTISTKLNPAEGVVVIRLKHRPRSMVFLSNSDGSSSGIVSQSPGCPTPASMGTRTSAVSAEKTNNLPNVKQKQCNSLPPKDSVTKPLYFREQESRKRCISDDSLQDCDFSGESDESSVRADSDDTYLPNKPTRRVTKQKPIKKRK